ncbi:MAG TPA: hypothetical protein VF042_15145 [Gemmatimonadaceae bacterium]
MTSLRAFLAGIVDYAGLFPPARLDMGSAVHAYAKYLKGSDSDLLGRFVIPVSRLDEFAADAEALLTSSSDPWRLSAIVSDDLPHARTLIEHFNASHSGRAICDTVETVVNSHDDIRHAVSAFPDDVSLFLEVGSQADPAYLVSEIATTSASAKIRTGGTVASAIPSPDQVLRFISSCIEQGVPFKATAGLHHAIRGEYPLTYEPNSPRAVMFGYLNVFLAAAFCAAGASESAVLGALEETNASAFRFDDTGVWWGDHVIVFEQLTVVRQAVATSFGSCSFVEPVSEARDLNLI